ncbi:MAG: hypothetical protein ACLSHC_01550 [Bilophila wadsworthia]
MKVFPLKYAWAEDMSVNSMDKTVTIPGVASILRAMVTGSPNSATRVTQDTATVDKLSGTGHRAGTDDARGSRCPARRAAGRTGRSAECHASEHYGRSARQCGAGQ